ncbi:Myosin heavy chain [Phytophthora megakarya]|uniref:Myosin heavy chain n=1 Tax=Phytophthora megakarya TaxID=4795 RepID=A0A225W0C8_9STRA|nr:Myosin heavy chain [Phytophthora megakarya]
MARASKVRAVSDELEAQRSALRAAKKHVAQVQTDNDALRKQLANVKRDGTHLSDIIDSQRVEYASYTDELVQTKNAKKQLLKRVAGLTQQVGQLHNEVADAKDDLSKNNELKNCQNDLTSVLAELQHISHAFDEEKQEKRVSRERKYRKELARMRELLEDNQQRASESSKGVQNLRRELLSVQKLLHGCTSEGGNTPTPIDQWAEALRNSVKANTLGV